MPEVTLAQVLQAREDRVRMQQALLQQYRCPLICFTMNIAGPVKTSALIERAFHAGTEALQAALAGRPVLAQKTQLSVTGCQAMYAVAWDTADLKRLCVAIEEQSALGRLFDMDVLDAAGRKLERQTLRGCIVCGAPGRSCAAGRLHSVAQLQAATQRIITEHFAQSDRKRFADLAVQSLLQEVCTTPKPGLVDCRNNGSHTDMDAALFTASAHALEPYFDQCIAIGQRTAQAHPDQTFRALREAGIAAEKTMYQVTGGVNTHKGAIYTLGILCGGLGRLWKPETPAPKLDRLLRVCADMARPSAQTALAAADASTAGLRLYRAYGITGARGEAAAGFPSVTQIGLPAYTDALDRGLSQNDAGVVTLLQLIAHVEDTNLYHRGGKEGAAFAAKTAEDLLRRSPYPSMAEAEALDDAFIARRLSPGGCADLLAATFFLYGIS